MIKIFLSHQAQDAKLTLQIADHLRKMHQIDSYLDVIDPDVKSGEDLAYYIRSQMNRCTQLLAVVSENTRLSWWVPWEIGVASEKEFPLATYAGGAQPPPEYLRKWPYLRSMQDVDLYAKASKSAEGEFVRQRKILLEADARPKSTKVFFEELRRGLGQ